MDPLSITASVVSLLTFAGATLSKGYQILAAIRDSGDVVAGLLAGLSELTGVLTAIKAQQSLFKAKSASQSQANEINALLSSSISDCEKTIKAARDVLEKIEKSRSLVLAAKLHLMKAEVEDLVQTIERQKQIFIICLGIDTRRKADDLLSLQHAVSGQIQDIKGKMDEEHRAAEEQRCRDNLQKLFSWLPLLTEDRKDRASRLAIRGTGDWVLHTQEFIAWRDGPTQISCIDGIAGAGKTFLMAHIVDHLGQLPGASGRRTAVAHYFCAYNDSRTELPTHIFCSLAAQILRALPDPQTSQATSFFRECDEGTRLPSLARAQDLIAVMSSELEKVYLLIDALDEANDRIELVECMMLLIARSSKIKLLVSSRTGDYELSDFLMGVPCIHITPARLQDDITVYIRHRLEHGPPRLKKLEPMALVDKLSHKADGMFLWVSCQIDQLARPSRYRDIEEALQRLPPDLFATYARILNNITPENTLSVARALCWLSFAAIPLTLDELIEAIAVEEKCTSLADLEKLQDPLDILQICGSLVRYSDVTGKVELAHHSVYEYLTSSRNDVNMPAEFRLEKKASLAVICRTMLTFLNLGDFCLSKMQSHVDPDLYSSTTIPSYGGIESAFLDYAIRNWWRMWPDNTQGVDDIWPALVAFLDHDTGNFASSVLLLRHLEGDYRYPPSMQPVHFCAMHGLPILQRLYDYESFDAGALIDDGRTALHIAAENRHLELVKQLVQLGASTDTVSMDGRNPLQVALESGDEAIVRFLIRKHASIDAQFINGDTPLSVAVSNHWQPIVALLLAEKVDPNKVLSDGKTALHVAAQVGADYDTFQLLFQAGAERCLGDDDDWTPLHYAAHYGHTEAVLLLLGGYTDFKAQERSEIHDVFTRIGWTPLHAAVQQEHLQIFELLSGFAEVVSTVFAGTQARPARMDKRSPKPSRQPSRSRNPRRPQLSSSGKPTGTARNDPDTGDDSEVESSQSTRLVPTAAKKRKTGDESESEFVATNPKKRIPTPLWLATNQQWLPGLQALLQAGVSSDDLRTCIEFAALNGKTVALENLVSGSVDAFLFLLDIARSDSPPPGIRDIIDAKYESQWNDAELSVLLPNLLRLYDLSVLQIILCSNFAVTEPISTLSAEKYHILEQSVIQSVEEGHQEALEILYEFASHLTIRIKKRAKISKVSSENWSLLHLAADANNVSIVTFLVQQNFSVGACDSLNRTPLHFAVFHNNEQLIDLLVADNSSNLNARDQEGCTALHHACRVAASRATEALLEAGADVRASDNRKRTALHEWAISKPDEPFWNITRGEGGIWSLLLSYGASQTALDDEGFTPIELAFIKSVIGNGSTVSAALHQNQEWIRAKLGPKKRTALHYAAAESWNPQMLQLLVSWGAELEAEDIDGKTPTQIAMESNRDWLINHGARWKIDEVLPTRLRSQDSSISGND